MKTRTTDLANEWGLDIVEVTNGMNGHPEGLYKAIVGFSCFENADDFAEQVNGEVVLLSRRIGHHFWTNNGSAYEGIESAKCIDKDRYKAFESTLDFGEWCRKEIECQMNSGFNLFCLRDKIDQMCDTYNKICEKGRDEIAIVDIEDYTCETTDKYVCAAIHDDDVTTYMIAVVDHETDEDEANEED